MKTLDEISNGCVPVVAEHISLCVCEFYVEFEQKNIGSTRVKEHVYIQVFHFSLPNAMLLLTRYEKTRQLVLGFPPRWQFSKISSLKLRGKFTCFSVKTFSCNILSLQFIIVLSSHGKYTTSEAINNRDYKKHLDNVKCIIAIKLWKLWQRSEIQQWE